MEQQPVQPHTIASHPVAPPAMPNRATNDTVMQWFNHLLKTRPMAFWGGVWVSVFLIAVVAFGSLMSPNAAERRSVSAIAIGSDSVVATQPIEQKGKIPFWLFGAIAVTCTAGSFLISRQLSPASSVPSRPAQARTRQQLVRQARPSPVQPPQKQRTQHPLPKQRTKQLQRSPKPLKHQPKRLKPYSPQEALFRGVSSQPYAVSPLPMTAISQKANPSYSVPVSVSQSVGKSTPTQPGLERSPQQVPVTVVPTDQSHPLDWSEPRLAEAVDLRKRKPIKSWL